uniref:Putative secreted peptide n=1 Tax=Anopheles braziliensis TaxID=58242 RepID=A0A2M3ZX43_9DIPT
MVVFGCVWLVCLLLQLPMRKGGWQTFPATQNRRGGQAFASFRTEPTVRRIVLISGGRFSVFFCYFLVGRNVSFAS